jgi:hypothetical protein
MRHSLWILFAAAVAGCASPKAVVTQAPASAPAVPAAAERKAVETAYAVRGYRDFGSPEIRHEAHVVFRRTLVPTNADAMDTVPRSAFAPASLAPLPASEELNAELAKQKAITAEMQAMQADMMATQSKMQAQYAQLVKQSGEALRLRDRLEAERSQARANAATPPEGVADNTDPKATTAKW